MKLRVASRGSRLSLKQVEIAMNWLRRKYPDIDYEVLIVKTKGDIHQDKPFTAIGGKGLFEKEVNMAVLRGDADVAVHSLKDVPSIVHPRLVLGLTPPRDPPYDLIVTRKDLKPDILSLPSGAVVGTASVRRKAAILHLRPDLRVEVLRGNVDTRLRKLVQGLYDAIVIAEAGLVRIWDELPPEIRNAIHFRRLSFDEVPPPPCQGIIGVYTVREREELVKMLIEASDERAFVEARAERAFLARFGGGCHVPVGVLAEAKDSSIVVRAVLYTPDGSKRVEVETEGSIDHPELVGIECAELLRREALSRGVEVGETR